MRVAITIVSGPSAGQRFVLKNGQAASVGKSAWNDFAVSDDDRMEDTQFHLRCEAPRSILVTHDSATTSLLNGRLLPPKTQHLLQDGDKIAAGRSEFVIRIEGSTGGESSPLESKPAAPTEVSRQRIAERIALLELLNEDFVLDPQIASGEAFESKLLSEGKFGACLRWKGFHCDKKELIGWLHNLVMQIVGPQAKPLESEAASACKSWIDAPNDTARMQCLALAERLKWRGPFGAMAAAIGWSGGSLTANEQNPVPPDARLTSRCVAIAVEELGRRLTSPPDAALWSSWIQGMPKPTYVFTTPTEKQ